MTSFTHRIPGALQISSQSITAFDTSFTFLKPSMLHRMARCLIWHTGYLNVAGVGNIASNMNWGRNTNTYSPRVGFAYQARPSTVLRGGYGRSFDIGVFGSIFGHAATQNLPVLSSQEVVATGGPLSQAFTLASGPPAPTPIPVPSNGLLPNPGYSVSSRARPNPLRLPTLDAWNLSLQQSLTSTVSLTIAYVGNR